MKLLQPKPGDLFNRRECGWYVSAKHKDAVLWLGLIAHAKKDWDVAKAWWEKLYRIDSHFRDSDQTHAGSTPGRLLWNLENNRGGLYGTKEQLDVFKSTRSRMMVLIADLELEDVNLPEAERKFRKMLEDKEIQANREMAAYCTFALTAALSCQFKTNECLKLLEDFVANRKYSGTKITPKAILLCGNLLSQNRTDEKNYAHALACYVEIVKLYPKAEEADSAMFYLAEIYFDENKWAEAEKRLNQYLKVHPKGIFREAAKEMIDVIRSQKQ